MVSHRAPSFPLVLIGASFALVGCLSIAGLTDDYSLGAASGAAPTAGGPTTTGSGNHAAMGGGATGGAAGATTTTTSSTNVGGAGASGGIGGAGGTGNVGGSGGFGGSGGSEPVAEMPCGGALCSGGDLCCVTEPPNQYLGCVAPGGCAGGFEIHCDGPEDCPDWEPICCGYWVDGYYSVECAVSCEGAGEYVLCKNDVGNCIYGGSCYQSSSLPGYGYCG